MRAPPERVQGTVLANFHGRAMSRVGATAMQHSDSEQYRLEITLMDDPCMWRWEIRDASRDAVVASSWQQEWTAYPSREEAYRAGRERLIRVAGA